MTFSILQVYVPLKKQPTSSMAKFLQQIMMPTWKTSSATVTPIDVLVQNYPVSQDDITQIHTASTRTKPAIIEIKGL
jgi:hypothetical protein